MTLTQKTIGAILNTASPWIHSDAAETSFALVCTVEEGMACRFSQADWGDKSLQSLAPAIINELGWKSVEHSAQRQVLVRCTAPERNPARATCEIDRGDGFVAIQVSAS